MCLRELLDVLRTFEQLLDPLDKVTDGAIAFTLILWFAYSTAIDRVSAAMAPFAAV